MRQYSFVTRWHLDAPVQRVWDAIIDVASWPCWWKYVKSVVPVEKGDAAGLGAIHRFTWVGRIPYRFCFDSRVTKIEPPSVLEASALGELSGQGRWTLTSGGRSTRVRCDWDVSTSKAWMNLLAPVLEPVFRWNHDQIMSEGGRALARHVGVNLLDAGEAGVA